MKAIQLKTEYLENPIGIDIIKPRLMWKCDGGQRQTAYRVTVTCSGSTVWDSGKVESASMHADMPVALKSRMRLEWTITLWDEEGKEETSAPATFEVGLLNRADWKAKWIAGDYSPKKKRYPVDCFAKEFEVKDVLSARLYISACGLYTAKINGKKAGDAVLTPGSTDYRKRVQYQTYDVTSLLAPGGNKIECELADGWYRGSSGSKGRLFTYGKQTKLIAQLEIKGRDGKITTIVTDGSWKWSDDGPVRFADLKDGEVVDARMVPSYSGRAREVDFTANLTASNNLLVKENERFKPQELITTPSGKKVLRFEQNLSGYIHFNVKAKAGQKIFIRLGEMLDDKGEFTQVNIQCIFKGKPSPLQQIEYICKDGENDYTPKYFFGGFMYALIETDVPFDKEDFEAVAVYSAFEQTSTFECSHELINKFFRNTLWSLKSNSTDIPTDCPTRERMGWTGDSQVFFNTASFMVDYAAFSRKHVRDIYDRQWKSGRLPQIVPYANEDWFMWVMNGSVGWACAGVYIPLNYYRKYGDKRLLEKYYEGMIAYANFMISRAGKWGGPYAKPMHISRKNRKYAVNCGQSYGEWAEPADVCAFKWYDFAAPHPEESTAYTYYTLQKVLEAANILGKQADPRLAKVRQYSEGARTAYQEMVTTPQFTIDTDRQAKLVRPIYMGLLTKEQEEFAKKRLIKAMENYGWRLGTGFLSTPLILDVLAGIDVQYAYKLLENEQMPGWLFMPKFGATTVWEAWEGNTTKEKGLASLNHYSKGAVCEWLLSRMCGINVAGENSFEIKPLPGGSITYASGEYDSVYGKVSASWKIEEGKFRLTVGVPSNTSAKVTMPSGEEKFVNAGEYTFEQDYIGAQARE